MVKLSTFDINTNLNRLQRPAESFLVFSDVKKTDCHQVPI
jgi:hypothetical protein